MKKLLLVLAIVVMASVALPMSALAADADVGTLEARGNGHASLVGSMEFRATADAGELVVTVHNRDTKVYIRGCREKVRLDNVIICHGFHGAAYVEGRQVEIELDGHSLKFQAKGHGRALLRGDGTYKLNGGEPQDWPADVAF